MKNKAEAELSWEGSVFEAFNMGIQHLTVNPQGLYALCENNSWKPLPKISLAWLMRHELGGKSGGKCPSRLQLEEKVDLTLACVH